MILRVEVEVSDFKAPTSEEDCEAGLVRLDDSVIVDALTYRLFAFGWRDDDTGVEVERLNVRNEKGQFWDGQKTRWV